MLFVLLLFRMFVLLGGINLLLDGFKYCLLLEEDRLEDWREDVFEFKLLLWFRVCLRVEI